MKETEYTYAVARVRANELSLLDSANIEQLIIAADYKSALKMLSDKGFKVDEGSSDYTFALENASEKAWEFIEEIAPDIHELDMLVVKNDFQNLKAALKAIVSRHEPKELFTKPTCIPAETIHQAVENRDFDLLPAYMSEAAKKAYDVLTRTSNGQKADIILDKATLEAMIEMSQKSSSQLLVDYAELICAVSNIKTAYRAVRTGKEQSFFEMAIAECKTLNKASLIEAALKGENELFSFLDSTNYAVAAEMLRSSTTEFEKWCDDSAINIMKKAKWSAFGVAPIAAYFLAKDAEIKILRIVLSAKKNDIPADEIRKRVRELYV